MRSSDNISKEEENAMTTKTTIEQLLSLNKEIPAMQEEMMREEAMPIRDPNNDRIQDEAIQKEKEAIQNEVMQKRNEAMLDEEINR